MTDAIFDTARDVLDMLKADRVRSERIVTVATSGEAEAFGRLAMPGARPTNCGRGRRCRARF